MRAVFRVCDFFRVAPKELLNLPQPWGESDFLRRREQIKRLSYEPNEIRTALNVLERCLHSLSILTPPKESDDSIPESLMESWVFTAHWLASEMPTLDELRLYKVEGKLKEYGIESPSPTLTRQLAKEWLWSVVWGIGKAALKWVQRALQKSRESFWIMRFSQRRQQAIYHRGAGLPQLPQATGGSLPYIPRPWSSLRPLAPP